MVVRWLIQQVVGILVNWISFDYRIIPLATKLKDSGVFGSSKSSDDYYINATTNRNEWKIRGKDIVYEMIHQKEEKEQELNTKKILMPRSSLSSTTTSTSSSSSSSNSNICK